MRPAQSPLALPAVLRGSVAGLSVGSWLISCFAVLGGVVLTCAEASDGTQRALIPTAIASIVALRKKGQLDEEGVVVEIEPSHKVTKFLFGVVNSGVYEDIDKHVAEELEVTLNGNPIASGDPGMTGTETLRATVESWRSLMPDLQWALLDEVHKKDRIALRFRVRGTPVVDSDEGWTGEPLVYEVGAFLHLDGKRVREAHQYIDLQQITEALDAGTEG